MAETLATRMAFGRELIEIGKVREDFVLCNADTKTCGLEAIHTLDNYVWYTDGNWHGFDGKAQPNVSAPYLLCPTHTKETWEKFQEEQKKEEATQPTDPAQP